MKNYLFSFCFVLFHTTCCFAQKPVINPLMQGRWGSINIMGISNDGGYVMYSFLNNYPGVMDSRLIIRSTTSTWEKEIKNFNFSAEFTDDSREIIFKTSGDSIGILPLGSDRITYIPGAESFKIATMNKRSWAAYNLKKKGVLVLKDLLTKLERKYLNVKDYLFSEDGKVLVLKKEFSDGKQEISRIDLTRELTEKTVWTGKGVSNILLDRNAHQMAFIVREEIEQEPHSTIWFYVQDVTGPLKIADDNSAELEGAFAIDRLDRFDIKNGNLLFFLKKNSEKKYEPGSVNVDVWSYTDPKLQSQQLKEGDWNENRYRAIVRTSDYKTILLERKGERLKDIVGAYALVLCSGAGNTTGEWNWNKTASSALDIISIKDGVRKRVLDGLTGGFYYGKGFFKISPDEKYMIYFDPKEQQYFSYDISSGRVSCITKNIQAIWTSYLHRDEPDAGYIPIGHADFVNNGEDILLYSRNDIFQVNLAGKRPPINLTNNYGKERDVTFRILFMNSYESNKKNGDRFILNAFDRNNGNNGFYSAVAGKKSDPVLLTMQPCMYTGPDETMNVSICTPVKAKNADVYLVTRQKASSFPNLFLTKDFIKFEEVTQYHPEQSYNWMTSELHTWKGLRGDTIKGILYKPENFDSTKKYPVIFYYYEKLSETLHGFLRPELNGSKLDIPYFVSNGYLVFVPDIPKIMGHPGPSAVNAVVSAANYLSRKSYVDSTRLGLQGHSFGGFETNYIITHSNKFAAAMSSASMTDFISCYGSIMWLGDGASRQQQYEVYHDAIGASMWERPDSYIENSPVLYADKVICPVLMMNNISDEDVPFAQGVEFFTALRRLGKRAWMLQYDKGGHMVLDKQAEDLAIRTKQFFDHYLMDKPAPLWMTRGIPAKDKGIKDGLEYDTEIKTPGEGLLLPEEKQKIDSFKYRKPFTITIP